MADAVATAAGACLGTSTTTTFVESASGVAVGGRTGLTAFVVAVCFALALFFSPLFLAIPAAATGPALVIVGVMMCAHTTGVDWEDFTEAIPAFVTLLMMPLSYSISDGIMLGIIMYVLMKVGTGMKGIRLCKRGYRNKRGERSMAPLPKKGTFSLVLGRTACRMWFCLNFFHSSIV